MGDCHSSNITKSKGTILKIGEISPKRKLKLKI
jgi:hypothetical protein